MQALVYTRPGTVELLEVVPPAPAEDELVLEVLAAGICGSELEGVRAPNSLRVPPLVMGHELVGRRLDTGEVVAVNPLVSCGDCDLCSLGRTNLCRDRQLIGVHRPGGFAELVAVPASCCKPLPADIAIEQAVLAEPLANAIHALRLAESHLGCPPRSLGVIGAGMLGIACALAAAKRGIRDIVVADLSEDRLALAAKTLGVEATKRLEGELDLVVDAVGLAETRSDAVALSRPGGVSVWIGLHQPDAGFDSRSLVRSERVVCGAFAYLDAEFDEAVELCRDADPCWVEQVFLCDAAGRFSELMQAPGPVPKTIVVPEPRSVAASDRLPRTPG